MCLLCNEIQNEDFDTITSLDLFACPKIINIDRLPAFLDSLDTGSCKNLKSIKNLPKTLTQLYCNYCDNLIFIDSIPDSVEYFYSAECINLISVGKKIPAKSKVFKVAFCPKLLLYIDSVPESNTMIVGEYSPMVIPHPNLNDTYKVGTEVYSRFLNFHRCPWSPYKYFGIYTNPNYEKNIKCLKLFQRMFRKKIFRRKFSIRLYLKKNTRLCMDVINLICREYI